MIDIKKIFRYFLFIHTICQRSSDPFYIVPYYTKWVTTSWTHSIESNEQLNPFLPVEPLQLLVVLVDRGHVARLRGQASEIPYYSYISSVAPNKLSLIGLSFWYITWFYIRWLLISCCARMMQTRPFSEKKSIWWLFRCNQMHSTNRNVWSTPCVRSEVNNHLV